MDINELENNNSGLIIYKVMVGSHAYGTNTPTSDVDHRGVYISPLETVLGMDENYQEQISDETNDNTYFELKKFIELLSVSNPTVLEILNVPDRCIVYKHPIFDLILKEREKFISKKCKKSLGEYAAIQIKKARGLNKKIVNPMSKEKKNPLDFCSVIDGNKSYPLTKYFEDNNLEQRFCGLVKIPNARDMYALFYDLQSSILFGEGFDKEKQKERIESIKKEGKELGFGYKGIIIENSNDIRLSSVPVGENPLITISYNKDGYTKYCNDYRDYWDWDKKKNPHRFKQNMEKNKGYDSKNMLHCHRLLDMCIEIGEGKGIIIERPNVDVLLKIKRGEYEYDQLLMEAEEKMSKLDGLFEKSNLPDEVSFEFCNELLIKIRKEFYKI